MLLTIFARLQDLQIRNIHLLLGNSAIGSVTVNYNIIYESLLQCLFI